LCGKFSDDETRTLSCREVVPEKNSGAWGFDFPPSLVALDGCEEASLSLPAASVREFLNSCTSWRSNFFSSTPECELVEEDCFINKQTVEYQLFNARDLALLGLCRAWFFRWSQKNKLRDALF
jgi:hypothetical protein